MRRNEGSATDDISVELGNGDRPARCQDGAMRVIKLLAVAFFDAEIFLDPAQVELREGGGIAVLEMTDREAQLRAPAKFTSRS